MPLLPYDTLLIDSPFPAGEVRRRLRGATGPVRWWLFNSRTHPFMGEVTEGEVRIHRAIGYQNAFLPRIRGRIEPAAQGSRLAATMTLHPLVAILMAVWMGFALTTGIPMLVLALAARSHWEMVLLPVGMLLFGWLLVSGAFTFEARIARAQLTELLQGRAATAVPAGAGHPPTTSAAAPGAPVRPHPDRKHNPHG